MFRNMKNANCHPKPQKSNKRIIKKSIWKWTTNREMRPSRRFCPPLLNSTWTRMSSTWLIMKETHYWTSNRTSFTRMTPSWKNNLTFIRKLRNDWWNWKTSLWKIWARKTFMISFGWSLTPRTIVIITISWMWIGALSTPKISFTYLRNSIDLVYLFFELFLMICKTIIAN